MTLKEYLQRNSFRQVRIAESIGMNADHFNRFLMGKVELPEKYVSPLASYLKLSPQEIKDNRVRDFI